MSTFDRYASYYDLLYADKDYAEEADYVDSLISRHRSGASTLLDLGCGTGRHALALARHGYRVHGVDVSESMLAIARQRSVVPTNTTGQFTWSLGDVRSFRAKQQFDAVVALFHVASYQTAATDLERFFETAHRHLLPGGVFLFDFWYGPAVLHEEPSIRVRRIEDGTRHILRLAEPILHENENCVDVRYTLIIRDAASNTAETLSEMHRMRYLFLPEVEMLVTRAGFRVPIFSEWLSSTAPSLKSWSVVAVTTK